MFLGKGTDRYEQRSISNAAMAAGIMISLRSLVRELKRSTLAVPFIPNLEVIYRCEDLCLFSSLCRAWMISDGFSSMQFNTSLKYRRINYLGSERTNCMLWCPAVAQNYFLNSAHVYGLHGKVMYLIWSMY